jgi:hypothetical protein
MADLLLSDLLAESGVTWIEPRCRCEKPCSSTRKIPVPEHCTPFRFVWREECYCLRCDGRLPDPGSYSPIVALDRLDGKPHVHVMGESIFDAAFRKVYGAASEN